MMAHRTILNLTGEDASAAEYLRGVYNPGPHTDSTLTIMIRSMTEGGAEGQARTIAAIAEIERAHSALIDGPPWMQAALTKALADRGITAVSRTHLNARPLFASHHPDTYILRGADA